MRVALKFGYDGSEFWGYQRQPKVRTVEGDILRGLKKTKMITDVKDNNFQSSSRTDRGASAIGNVIAFDTNFKKGHILKALNPNVRDIYFWGIAEVEDGFNPRYAKQRWYRYHLGKELDVNSMKSAASLFIGKHDFQNFCRESERSTIREIDSIKISRKGNFIYFDIRAESFLWNMVRRIVNSVAGYAKGELTKKIISEALAGKREIRGSLPAHPLFLMDVSYDFAFDAQKSAIPSAFRKNYEKVTIQEEFFSGLQKQLG
jgi:tRNA pseudouridine38-40 synthase